MSKLRGESTTPEVDYVVNAIEVLLGACLKLVVTVVPLPLRLLCWKSKPKPGSTSTKCN
jgi:hypothetical protein